MMLLLRNEQQGVQIRFARIVLIGLCSTLTNELAEDVTCSASLAGALARARADTHDMGVMLAV